MISTQTFRSNAGSSVIRTSCFALLALCLAASDFPLVRSSFAVHGFSNPTMPSYTPTKLRSIAKRMSIDPAIRIQDPLYQGDHLEHTSSFQQFDKEQRPLKGIAALLTKVGMMLYIASMCAVLPIALFPPYLLLKLKLISKIQQEQMSLRMGQFSARWLLRLIPFCRIQAIPSSSSSVKSQSSQGKDAESENEAEPSIWVCNHSSALDIFMMLAADKTLRGTSKKRRPIKIVYWQQLEDNPITKLLFRQCGFIPVQMTANAAGEDNDYDLKSFKRLLKEAKKAFKEGFDIGILPEGQLNPDPEKGLLPCFPGAFTLAKMSKRPIQMMALHGTHRLWHAVDGMENVTGRHVRMRVYPSYLNRKYQSGDEFVSTFDAVVGQFGSTGYDLPEKDLEAWLDGSKWKQTQSTNMGETSAL